MVQFVDVLIAIALGSIGLVLLRWFWLRSERRKIIEQSKDFTNYDNDSRFNEPLNEDEYDRTYSGRILKKLRSKLIEGRVEIHWQFYPHYIHRGYVLTAKCRRNDSGWEHLALEGTEDSGSWVECFNYGESRSYVFTVKKTYHCFFGLISNDEVEVLYDQISFSMRKGRYLKERKELIRDRKELLSEVKDYVTLEAELRKMAGGPKAPELPNDPIAKLEGRYKKQRQYADFIEKQEAEIRANPNWTDERKEKEIDRLHEMAEEQMLGEE